MTVPLESVKLKNYMLSVDYYAFWYCYARFYATPQSIMLVVKT